VAVEICVYLGIRRSDRAGILANLCKGLRLAGGERASDGGLEDDARSPAIGRDLAAVGDWT
jgi:hypothetical protein